MRPFFAQIFLIALGLIGSATAANNRLTSVSPISILNPCEAGFMGSDQYLDRYLRGMGARDSDVERTKRLISEPKTQAEGERFASLERSLRNAEAKLTNLDLREVMDRLPVFIRRLGSSSWLSRITYGDVWTRELFDALITWAPFWIGDPESHRVCRNLIGETYVQDLGYVFGWCMKAMPEHFHSSFISMFQDRIADARFWNSAEESDWYIQLLSFFSPNDLDLIVPLRDRPTWFANEDHISRRIISNNVRTIWFGKARCGRCVDMFRQHISGLGLNSSSIETPSILIMVDGALVGALKLDGDHSLLALRNVTDSGGRLVLVEGAVYGVSKSIREAALSEKGESSGLVAVEFRQLEVFPRALVMNEHSRYSELEDWFAALDGRMERQEIDKLKYYYPQTLRKEAFKYLLDRLRKRRSALENQIHQGQMTIRHADL